MVALALLPLLLGALALAAPTPGDDGKGKDGGKETIVTNEEKTDYKQTQVSFKEYCFLSFYATTENFKIEFEKEVLIKDVHGNNVFVLDGLKKMTDDTQFYFREFCYKDLNITKHQDSTNDANQLKIKDGKLESYDELDPNSVDLSKAAEDRKAADQSAKSSRFARRALGDLGSGLGFDDNFGSSTSSFGGSGADFGLDLFGDGGRKKKEKAAEDKKKKAVFDKNNRHEVFSNSNAKEVHKDSRDEDKDGKKDDKKEEDGKEKDEKKTRA
ncbi:hypothetical protein JCM8097_000490 [Rhodosporidiobolus ruineniae]